MNKMNKVEKKMVEKIELDIKWWLNPDAYADNVEKEKRLRWLEHDYRKIQGELNMLLWFMTDKANFEGSEDEKLHQDLVDKSFKEYLDTKHYIEDHC